MEKRKKILEKSRERQRSAVAPGAWGKNVCVGVILHVGSLYSIILFFQFSFGIVCFLYGRSFFLDWDLCDWDLPKDICILWKLV